MPPKKRATDSADPQPTSSKVSAEETAVAEKSGATAVRKRAAHPTTAIMVREALKDLDSRKGVSSQAIQSFIKRKYPSADGVRLKNLVRSALIRGIESGTLVRPVNSVVTTGSVLGKFRLAPEKQPKAKIENSDPNVQKAPTAAKNGVKRIKKAEGSTKKSSAKEESAEKPPKKSKKAGEAASSNVPKAAKDGVGQIQTSGATKKSSAEKVESAEPPKKSKKVGEAASSKVVPAKKPKAKGSVVGTSDSTKAKATKVTKERKMGKAAQSKAAEASEDAPAPKAAGKRGKKTE